MERKLQWMQETEVQTFQKWGLDIQSHRTKMEKRELDKEFKDAANPLRVVFVCAMWLTGFDVKCLSCLYLDKPLKAHTLMQTIAAAESFLSSRDFSLQTLIDAKGFEKLALLQTAANTVSAPPGGKEDFSDLHL